MITGLINLNFLHNLAQIVPEYSAEELAAAAEKNKTTNDPPYLLIGMGVILLILIILVTLRFIRHKKRG